MKKKKKSFNFLAEVKMYIFLKRSQEFDGEIDAENYESYETEDGLFRKKIKLDHDTICQKISRKYPEIDINEYELSQN